MKRLTATLGLAALLAGTLLLPGCRTHAGTGALLGSAIGGGAGYAIGRHNKHPGRGTAIGAVAGGLLGYMIGNEADRSERDYYGPPAPRYGGYGYDYGPPHHERVIYRERYVAPPRRVVVREYYGPSYYSDEHDYCDPTW